MSHGLPFQTIGSFSPAQSFAQTDDVPTRMTTELTVQAIDPTTAMKDTAFKPHIVTNSYEDDDNPTPSPVPVLPKPRSSSRSKSNKSGHKFRNKSKSNASSRELATHIDIASLQLPDIPRDDSYRIDQGFPDTPAPPINIKKKKEKHKRERSSFQHQQKTLYSRSYYMEHSDNDNINYSYFDGKIRDKLVWFAAIEKLLPATIAGQFIYALLNTIFPSDLYYSFHRYEFEDGFETEHKMDDFFTSRRLLSIQNTIPGLFPSMLWYQIIKYEPTPYKSMCYYQYIRQKDADKIYKLPNLFGYIEMILICGATIVFCLNIDDDIRFFNYDYKINVARYSDLFLFAPFSYINLWCYALLGVTFLHILCIFIVWRITWFLHFKIYDYKERIYNYLSRRRAKEMRFLESLYVGNKSKINRESKHRIYYKISNHSYLYFKRNGELFISLLKWINVIEYEQDLDLLVTSKKNWVIITFALHKYFGIMVYAFLMLFGINLVTSIMSIMFIISYWIHCIELYTSDHHNLTSKSNQDFLSATSFFRSLCKTLFRILRMLLWPGILVYAVWAYCIYIMLFHADYFPVIWLGIAPIWLIIYSVLTRGYRRIYIFNGCALFMLYFVTINWFCFRNWGFVVFRYTTALFIIFFLFSYFLSMQHEMHRAMLFPLFSNNFKIDERAQNKFGGLDVAGAKLYTFAQYAAMYFKQRTHLVRTFSKNGKVHSIRVSGDFGSLATYSKDPWYTRWYLRRPLEAMKIPKPSFPFSYK